MEYRFTLLLVTIFSLRFDESRCRDISVEIESYGKPDPKTIIRNNRNINSIDFMNFDGPKQYGLRLKNTLQERIPQFQQSYFGDVKDISKKNPNNMDVEESSVLQNQNTPFGGGFSFNLNQLRSGIPDKESADMSANKTDPYLTAKGNPFMNSRTGYDDQLELNMEISKQTENSNFKSPNQKVVDINSFEENQDMLKSSEGYGICSCCGGSTKMNYDSNCPPKPLIININSDCSPQPRSRLVHKYVFRPNCNKSLNPCETSKSTSFGFPGMLPFYYL